MITFYPTGSHVVSIDETAPLRKPKHGRDKNLLDL